MDTDVQDIYVINFTTMLKNRLPYYDVYKDETHLIFYLSGIDLTIDLDIQWIRIHRWEGYHYKLLTAIDLAEYWDNAPVCYSKIMDKLGEFIE
jgi:hypothetical protein